MANEAKLKARKAALDALNKTYGKGTAAVYGDMEPLDIEVISTGSIALDDALGCGGYARGRIVEIYGPEASGKTTLTLHAIAEAQKAGGLCAFIDAEHALDVHYARNLGVEVDDLVISQPDHGEQALEIVETLVRSGAFDMVVIDSVAALTPRAEIEGEMGDHHVGLQARLMSQALRKLAAVVHKTRTTVVFINQIRYKIGVMFGSPETTTGGNSLKFYASQRLDIRGIAAGRTETSNRSRVKVVKNKVAPPFKVCEFDIIFGKGVNKTGELVDAGVTYGFIEKSGAWYSFAEGYLDGARLGQGRTNSIDTLNSEAFAEALVQLEHDVRREMGLLREEGS